MQEYPISGIPLNSAVKTKMSFADISVYLNEVKFFVRVCLKSVSFWEIKLKNLYVHSRLSATTFKMARQSSCKVMHSTSM